MNKGFINFFAVLILFSISIILLAWGYPPHWRTFAALCIGIFAGYYAAKSGFGKV
jgi:hypothetical protein